MDTPAYVNHGRWVADCPVPDCGDAVALHPQDPRTGIPSPQPVLLQRCANGHELRLVAPPEEFRARIETALAERLSEVRRNWFPSNHPYALANGWPHGETPDDIRRQTEAGETADAEALAGRRAAALEQVRALDIPLDDVLNALKGI